MKKSEVQVTVLSHLAATLAPKGFRLREKAGPLVRRLEGGVQRLYMPIVDREPLFKYAIVPSVSFEKVSKIFSKFAGVEAQFEEGIDTAIFALLFVTEQGRDMIEVTNESQLRDSIPIVERILLNNVLPVLDRCTTIEEIDRVINAEGERNLENTNLFSRALNGVIVAGLTSNPRLEAITARYLSEMEKFPSEKKMTILECKTFVQSLVASRGAR